MTSRSGIGYYHIPPAGTVREKSWAQQKEPITIKNKNDRLFHNIPSFCDFVDCHTFTSLSCLTQPLTYNLYHYYLKSFLTCHFSLPQDLREVLAENLSAKL